jgi:2-C-methyl-D-erythritol 4-phosphate cytidylyltransferase / 2-C-methyl-D-erythritol 2,4-cyclodiphosphate synthase
MTVSSQGFLAIITAAGSGTRMGNASVPKQYASLTPQDNVLSVTLKKFLHHPDLIKLVCVIHPDHENFYKHITSDPRVVFCAGATTRAESVKAGFDYLTQEDEYAPKTPVLIHDGARPFIDENLISLVLEALSKNNSVCPVLPVRDTLRRADQNILQDSVDRTNMMHIQTPQGFHLNVLDHAYKFVIDFRSYTDESSLVTAAGYDVVCVAGDIRNFKITYDADLSFARAVINSHTMIKTAFGYDVHAFSADEAGPVMLCGVPIPHPRRLAGHSDADVALHALCDAIFGVLGDGDLGTHFPPSDPQWKNCASSKFVDYAMNKLHGCNAVLTHIDITIICEEPKITPHRDQMIKRLADLTKLAPHNIGLKATTSEKLGFTGRGEGIVAQAIITAAFHHD